MGNSNMKKFLLALSAVAAFTGSAMAADMAPRYAKAPPPVLPVYNWTGFYIFGGGGGGLWNAETNIVSFPGNQGFTRDTRMGGAGWFGTVGAGYDWQFNSSWVAGVFADGQFGDIRGSIVRPVGGFGADEGWEKLHTSYAAGVRLGYLVAPNVLSYVNGGYSGSQWSGASFSGVGAGGLPVVFTTPSFTRNGWFVGGGFENSLNVFGINTPGWFLKTEYRAAYYDRVTLPETRTATGLPDGFATTFNPWVQTISTSLVYRFNWGGPVVNRY
jgi:outer membrane immunogenic protein